MCDIALALPPSTVHGSVLFAKNSDRHCNEAQNIEYHAACEHEPDAGVRCTYVTIPQSRRTHAVLLCRPFWIWGAEMGANEHGVVIGNEGVHARTPASEAEALTGMDLVRLALERATTASEAIEIVTTLLERHGQGGDCGHITPAFYNNGFVVADASEAFVLETVNREWLVERISEGVRSMSNAYTIHRTIHGRSTGLLSMLHQAALSTEDEPDFAAVISNQHREHIGNANARHARSSFLLRTLEGRLTSRDMMSLLRDHGVGDQPPMPWSSDCTIRRTLCMHAGAQSPSQTVGSMVSELSETNVVHWVTGTSTPCMSIFKPILVDAIFPLREPQPAGCFDARTLWWRHERFHRTVLKGDFTKLMRDLREERDALESDFHAQVSAVINGGSADERSKVIAECWKVAIEVENRWFSRLGTVGAPEDSQYSNVWRETNRLAEIGSL